MPKQPKSAETKAKEDALVREILGRVADKWTLVVLEELAEKGVLRFTRLLASIGGITQKMLTKTLRDLERDGLVTRRVEPVVPLRVEYSLTPLGESLNESFCTVWHWVEAHGEEVERARRAFERKRRPSVTQQR